MKIKSVACIGQGFVGGSLTTVLSEKKTQVFVYDVSKKVARGGTSVAVWPGPRPVESLREFVVACEGLRFPDVNSFKKDNFSGIYFVCVPTPMQEDGACDTSIVENILKELSELEGNRIAVVKSTVPPGSTENWNKMFKKTGLSVVFCPEFLTEANALEDMRNQDRIILGGPRPHINKVKQFFSSVFPSVDIIKTNSTTAEMVKYFTNIHLATRVVLSCEFAQICESLDDHGYDIDYDKVQEYAEYDKRLGGTHMSMPEIRGARGHCFPKDLSAMVFLAKKLGFENILMEAVQKKNLSIVPPEHRDWEKMVGRAVSKKDKITE